MVLFGFIVSSYVLSCLFFGLIAGAAKRILTYGDYGNVTQVPFAVSQSWAWPFTLFNAYRRGYA